MGLKDAAVPMLLFFVAILAIAQSAITINSYLTTNKPKDSGFKFSMAVLVIAIFTLFGSGYFTYKAFGGGSAKVAENTSTEDVAAALAAKLGGISLPSTNEVAAAVPNVQAFTNVPTLRKAEADFKVAVEKTKTALTTLEESIDKRIADKVSALQQAAEVMALATSKGA